MTDRDANDRKLELLDVAESRITAHARHPRRVRPDLWIYFVALLLVVQVALYLVPHIRPGPLGWVCWVIGSDPSLWIVVAAGMLVIALVWALWKPPLINRWRVMGVLALLALVASTAMFRVYPSSYDNRPSNIRFRLPLDGPILVGWGGGTPGVNYHVAYPDQRWAYDLLVAENHRTFRGDGARWEDYLCYGLPVLAPADGKVAAVLDGMPDQPIGVLGGTPAGGNHVVIEVQDRGQAQFLFLCHLQRGSILVKEGESVSQGQPVAKVGNSGNTSEPHLHIHLQNTRADDVAEGIPLYFHNYRTSGQLVERGIPTGGFGRQGPIGQVVQHAGPNGATKATD
jgi:Peptidase family M23